MKTLWGKFLFRKHKRGKRMLHASMPAGTPDNVVGYRCPLCHAMWTRKVKPKPAEPAIPASIRK